MTNKGGKQKVLQLQEERPSPMSNGLATFFSNRNTTDTAMMANTVVAISFNLSPNHWMVIQKYHMDRAVQTTKSAGFSDFLRMPAPTSFLSYSTRACFKMPGDAVSSGFDCISRRFSAGLVGLSQGKSTQKCSQRLHIPAS